MLESLNKVADQKACKKTPAQVFSCECCEIFMNFFIDHFILTASAVLKDS